ncbi:MAG: bifunctional hydroxymethylpyrimidine kinase/phosphomethylpyrimidine kinase, partial [Pseudobutyrivibrio sp.]|nr:bifunctional hydroxymethylpyrimidine kinase/phosphomethylpyrimidine kinase [Pseudobutyrivibrio sp.]
MKKILVAGDIMLDTYVFGVVNRISPEAPVPVLLKDKTKKKTVPGGAANVAVNIKAANCDVDLLSMIGRDENATKLINLLNDISIGTASIIEDETSVTTTKLRYIGQNNQQILRVDSEEKLNISTDKKTLIAERLEQQLKEAEYSLILLSDYNKGFLSEDICQLIIREAVDSNIPVLVDVKGTNASKYNGATLLKPNRSELRDLTDMPVDTMEEVRQASQYLQKSTGCKYVLTTLGADGMYLYTEDGETKHIGTVAKEVYDVTGAGDTSIAYLAVCLAAGENIESAMEIANIAASVQVSKVGTSTVSWDEVELAKNAIGLQASKKQLNFYR